MTIRSVVVPAARNYSTAEPDLKETFKRVIPAKRELLKKVKALGDKQIGVVKVENTIGGMRLRNCSSLKVVSNIMQRIKSYGMGRFSS